MLAHMLASTTNTTPMPMRKLASPARTAFRRTPYIQAVDESAQCRTGGMRVDSITPAHRARRATAHITHSPPTPQQLQSLQHDLCIGLRARERRTGHWQCVQLTQPATHGAGMRSQSAAMSHARAAAETVRSARPSASSRRNPVAAIIAFHLRVPPARVQIKSLGTLTTGNCTCKGGKIFSIKSFTPPPPFGGEECVHPAPCPARMPALQISPIPLSPLVGVCDGEVYSKEGQCNFGSHTALSRVHAHPE